MKYLMIFLIVVGLSAKNENVELYKQEVKSLMNYTLKVPSKIYDVFIVQRFVKKSEKSTKITKSTKVKIFQMKPQNEITLLAILNNKVLLKINNQTKWVQIGNKIDNYKIMKILNNNSIIVFDNKKMRILFLNNKNNFKIKVR